MLTRKLAVCMLLTHFLNIITFLNVSGRPLAQVKFSSFPVPSVIVQDHYTPVKHNFITSSLKTAATNFVITNRTESIEASTENAKIAVDLETSVKEIAKDMKMAASSQEEIKLTYKLNKELDELLSKKSLTQLEETKTKQTNETQFQTAVADSEINAGGRKNYDDSAPKSKTINLLWDNWIRDPKNATRPTQRYNSPINVNLANNYYPPEKEDDLAVVCAQKSTIYNIPRVHHWLGRIHYVYYLKHRPIWVDLRREIYNAARSEECHVPEQDKLMAYLNCALRRNQRMEYMIPRYPLHQIGYFKTFAMPFPQNPPYADHIDTIYKHDDDVWHNPDRFPRKKSFFRKYH